MYVQTRSIQDFSFIDSQSERFSATIQFGKILRVLYEHPDWSQIYKFCSKRYTKRDMLSNRSSRVLKPTKDGFGFAYDTNKTATVSFNTNISSIGLPEDFITQIAEATRKAVARMLGPDPINCSIGPAMSLGIGPASYMDLIYGGSTPGSERPWKPMTWLAESKKDGRDRTPEEWRSLWEAIADWIYENEATSIVQFGGSHSYKYRLSDEENAEMRFNAKVPRKYLQTDAIHGADAIRDVFDQFISTPKKFHGIEWEFLDLEADPNVQTAFIARFGPKPLDQTKMMEDMKRNVSPPSYNRLGYNSVPPSRLRPCPDTFNGIDWERWMLSIEGGSVVVVETVFQVSIRYSSPITQSNL
jgi:hypothetical protein